MLHQDKRHVTATKDKMASLKHSRVEGPSFLDTSASESLMQEIIAVDEDACGVALARYWQRRASFLTNLAGIELSRSKGELVAFLGYQVWTSPLGRIVYLDTGAVRRSFQGTGLAGGQALRILSRVADSCDWSTFYVAARTQNPVLVDSFSFMSPGPMWPSALGTGGTCARPRGVGGPLAAVCEYVASKVDPGLQYDKEWSVIRGAFGEFVYDRLPAASARVMQYFDEHIDVTAGDTVVLAIQVNGRSDLRAMLIRALVPAVRGAQCE